MSDNISGLKQYYAINLVNSECHFHLINTFIKANFQPVVHPQSCIHQDQDAGVWTYFMSCVSSSFLFWAWLPNERLFGNLHFLFIAYLDLIYTIFIIKFWLAHPGKKMVCYFGSWAVSHQSYFNTFVSLLINEK